MCSLQILGTERIHIEPAGSETACQVANGQALNGNTVTHSVSGYCIADSEADRTLSMKAHCGSYKVDEDYPTDEPTLRLRSTLALDAAPLPPPDSGLIVLS